MMHVQEATENIHLIQEQLRRLRELSLADIDTSTPHDTAQATVDDDFSETQATSTVQQHWAPQYLTQAGSTPIDQLSDSETNNMKQICPMKRIIGRTKPVPQVAPYDKVHVTRRERMKNAQNRAQTIPTTDEMPADFCSPNGNQVLTTLMKSPGRKFLEPADLHLNMDTPRNLLSSAKSSFDALCRVMKSPQQQINQGHVAMNLFRDMLQRHRRPRSPQELQENCQDMANDTIAYR